MKQIKSLEDYAPRPRRLPLRDWPKILKEIPVGKYLLTDEYNNLTVRAAIKRLEAAGIIKRGEFQAGTQKQDDGRELTIIKHFKT